MKNHFYQILLRWIPKKMMSRWMGKFSRHRFSKFMIPYYIQFYNIDLTPVKRPVKDFENLLDFFIREYREDARPIDSQVSSLVSPVDGTVLQMGKIEHRSLLQVKGITYTLEELLGEDPKKISKYINGDFVTIYLSPKDYHRIHMPVTGEIVESTYISGDLYPVNRLGVHSIPGLFARNERLITYIQASWGEFGLIKVGATNVGSIHVTYDSEISTNQRTEKKLDHKHYHPAHQLKKGEELGRFEFGSTVILLFQPGHIEWAIEQKPGTRVQMGQELARIKKMYQ